MCILYPQRTAAAYALVDNGTSHHETKRRSSCTKDQLPQMSKPSRLSTVCTTERSKRGANELQRPPKQNECCIGYLKNALTYLY